MDLLEFVVVKDVVRVLIESLLWKVRVALVAPIFREFLSSSLQHQVDANHRKGGSRLKKKYFLAFSLNHLKKSYFKVLKTCVENRQYISGFAAEFNGAKLCIRVAIAILV